MDLFQYNDEEVLKWVVREFGVMDEEFVMIDFRLCKEMQVMYIVEEGKGIIEYVVGCFEYVDLIGVFLQLRGCEEEVD